VRAEAEGETVRGVTDRTRGRDGAGWTAFGALGAAVLGAGFGAGFGGATGAGSGVGSGAAGVETVVGSGSWACADVGYDAKPHPIAHRNASAKQAANRVLPRCSAARRTAGNPIATPARL
jgi:hypothetical protein